MIMKKLYAFLAVCALGTISFAQNNQKFWTSIPEPKINKLERDIIPNKYLNFSLDLTALKNKLLTAPLNTQVRINESN